jgi:hypothetical protein
MNDNILETVDHVEQVKADQASYMIPPIQNNPIQLNLNLGEADKE